MYMYAVFSGIFLYNSSDWLLFKFFIPCVQFFLKQKSECVSIIYSLPIHLPTDVRIRGEKKEGISQFESVCCCLNSSWCIYSVFHESQHVIQNELILTTSCECSNLNVLWKVEQLPSVPNIYLYEFNHDLIEGPLFSNIQFIEY